MKMVKSLLLGSAAGLVAVTGAQAADLPVKAKPVEYVKVCTLYGAGFYYIPGTDTCIKIGGYFRSEWLHNAGGSLAPSINGINAAYTRAGDTLRNRSRIITSFDVRSQTEYGTLRAYARAGWQWTTNDANTGGSVAVVYLDRAFIQFAGFTFGKTQSYFDFYQTGAYSLMTAWLHTDTGGSGTPVFAYTMQFGNGLSATLSAEDHSEQKMPIVNVAGTAFGSVSNGVFPITATATASATAATTPALAAGDTSQTGGNWWPDVIGNLRVDQAWGSAQVMGALHNLNAAYYMSNATSATAPGTTAHPNNKMGWAVGGGITLKMPWDAKDTFSGMVTYCKGAARYCSSPSGTLGSGLVYGLVNEDKIGLGNVDDAYYDGLVIGSSLELSKAWSAVAGFEHYWTPTLRSSVYGTYLKYEANSATVDARVCAVNPGAQGGPLAAGCADWSAWNVGTRTIWNPVANLDIGVEVLYTKVNTAMQGALWPTPAVTPGLSTPLVVDDTHVWAGVLRVQRNFWP